MNYARILILLLIVAMKVFIGFSNQGEAAINSFGSKYLHYATPTSTPDPTETLADTLHLAEKPKLY